MQRVVANGSIVKVDADLCQYGSFIRRDEHQGHPVNKPTGSMTNTLKVAASFSRKCSGEHGEAALQLSTALQMRLSVASKQQVLADRAAALHRAGRPQAALDDLAAGLRLGPTALELYVQRAQVLHGQP